MRNCKIILIHEIISKILFQDFLREKIKLFLQTKALFSRATYVVLMKSTKHLSGQDCEGLFYLSTCCLCTTTRLSYVGGGSEARPTTEELSLVRLTTFPVPYMVSVTTAAITAPLSSIISLSLSQSSDIHQLITNNDFHCFVFLTRPLQEEEIRKWEYDKN